MRQIVGFGERQKGLVTRQQAIVVGVPASTFDGWIAAGDLRRVQPGVVRFAGVAPSWDGDLLAAVLAAGRGAAASHRAAVVVWNIADDAPVEIAVPYERNPRLFGNVIIHRTRDPITIRRRNGIPVTTPMRALIDLGSVATAEAVEDSLDGRYGKC